MGTRECRENEQLLHLHRKGESGADELRRVEEHVRRCASCASTLAGLGRIDASLLETRAEVPLHPHAAAGVAAVMAKIGGRDAAVPGRVIISSWWRQGSKSIIAFKMGCVVCMKRDDAGIWTLQWMITPEIV